MNPILLIPARMASTRLPGKPLADIAGVPMIVRVWARAMAAGLGPVVVAAAEPEVIAAVEKAGGRAVMTDPDLPSGSDRIWAALKAADPEGRHDVVVNLQGDLPALDPLQIQAVTQALAQTGADIATLAAPIDNPSDEANPAVVKAIVAWQGAWFEGHEGMGRAWPATGGEAGPFKNQSEGQIGRALYFTRASAPTGDAGMWHHVGIYAYTREALQSFVALPPSPLEKSEKLEQLRALEAGMHIAVARVNEPPLSVDTPEDLERARRLLG